MGLILACRVKQRQHRTQSWCKRLIWSMDQPHATDRPWQGRSKDLAKPDLSHQAKRLDGAGFVYHVGLGVDRCVRCLQAASSDLAVRRQGSRPLANGYPRIGRDRRHLNWCNSHQWDFTFVSFKGSSPSAWVKLSWLWRLCHLIFANANVLSALGASICGCAGYRYVCNSDLFEASQVEHPRSLLKAESHPHLRCRALNSSQGGH